MGHARALVIAVLTLALPGTAAGASAVFFQTGDTSRVESRRTVLALDDTQTVWWEQPVVEAGAGPYAVLIPVKGAVSLGQSSDALFANLIDQMEVHVWPLDPCIGIQPCHNGQQDAGAPPDAGGSGLHLAEPTVLPTEVIILSDATSTRDWLTGHGMAVGPADDVLIDALITEGFSFVAVYVVPTGGVSRLRPLRITMAGLSPVLPLRADAIGAGSTPTPANLFVVAMQREQPANRALFTIADAGLVWDWDTYTSNLAALETAGFAAASGTAWLVESSFSLTGDGLGQTLPMLAMTDPIGSGYGDAAGDGAVDAANSDLASLFIGGARVTSLRARLGSDSFVQDLQIAPAVDQSLLWIFRTAGSSVGTPPACPGPCDAGVMAPDAAMDSGGGGGCGCRVGGRESARGLVPLLLLFIIICKRCQSPQARRSPPRIGG